MDTTRDIIYRGFKLNDSAIQPVPGSGTGDAITGCVIDSVDMSDVDVVQFMEKRSEQDGMDTGTVFLGARRIRIGGTLYGRTRALFYDAWLNLCSALSPTLAQREEPGDKGYRPLYFSLPTNRVSDYPTGVIDLRVLALPKMKQAVLQRDQQGGIATDSLAIPWQATFIMRDPSVQGATPQDYPFTATTEIACTASTADLVTSTAHGLSAGNVIYFTERTGGAGITLGQAYYVIATGLTANAFKFSATLAGAAVDITSTMTAGKWARVVTATGNLINRGNYHAPFNALFSVGPQAGTIAVSVGDSTFTITLPASTGDRLVRYKGSDKIVTIEESSVEELRMDVLPFAGIMTHPLVPGGTSPYSIVFTGVVVRSDAHMWFYEVYAW